MFGDWWGYVGWGSFLGILFIPLLARDYTFGLGLMLAAMVIAFVTWWIVDLVDQEVPAWMVVVGIVMLAIGVLPRGGILTIACWAIYWFKVRE